MGRFDITVFRREDQWRRSNVVLFQRCYTLDQVLPALEQAGFGDVTVCDAEGDLDMVGHTGRSVFVCRALEQAAQCGETNPQG